MGRDMIHQEAEARMSERFQCPHGMYRGRTLHDIFTECGRQAVQALTDNEAGLLTATYARMYLRTHPESGEIRGKAKPR
jgi:hypothetical protein